MNSLIAEIDEAQVQPDTLMVWWIGQEGFVIKSSELIIYIDPYLSDYAERITRGEPNEHVRMHEAPMKASEVGHADLVLCSHDHADHIDPDAIPQIAVASPEARFVVPRVAKQTLLGFGIKGDRIRTLQGNDSLIVSGVKIWAIPAKHEAFDHDPQKGFPYLSYVIKMGGITVFHAGDTIPYEGQVDNVRKHKIDLAFVPINGRDEFRHKLNFEGNFNCREAVEFALAINAKLTVPMHYDMFTLNTADVGEFRKVAVRKGLNYHVMQHAGSMAFALGIKHASDP